VRLELLRAGRPLSAELVPAELELS
jgi:hypothetical protein